MEESIDSGTSVTRLHELHGSRQQGRLVGQRDAGVDVEHVGAGLDLGHGIGLDAAEVAAHHLLGQQLATGRVDPLADHHERPVEADDDLPGGRAQDRLGHSVLSFARFVLGLELFERQQLVAVDVVGGHVGSIRRRRRACRGAPGE